MNNAILLHGKPDKQEYYDTSLPACSNFHWFPWLQKQLMVRDIYTQTPEVPNAYDPDYPTWCKEFERYDITPNTKLVGHSCGAGFLVRWLSEHPNVRVGKVVLVAPSLGIDWDSKDFFEFTIDPQLAGRTKGLVVFVSADDRPAIHQATARIIDTVAGAKKREFTNHGHFTIGVMKTPEFPELLEELVA